MSQDFDIANPDTWQDVDAPAYSPLAAQAATPEAPAPKVFDIADPQTWEDLPKTPDQARLALNFRAGKITPEQAQEAYALTRKTNLPQSAVLNDTARVKEMLEEHDLEAFGNDAPLAASWMAGDVIRTNIARDDTLSLKGLEGALQKRPGVMELAGQAYEANTQYLDDLNLWGRHMRGERSPELDSAMKEADQRMKAYAQSVPKQLGLGEEFVVNTAEQLPIQLSIMKERGKGYLVGPSIGAFVGSAVPGIGTLAGAGAGLFAGPASYSASEAYKLESVSAYREFRQDGIPDDAAAIASKAYGVAASVVEFADSIIDTSIIFGGALNPATKAATKMTIKSAMLGFMKNVGIGKATESAEEAIQQGLQVGIGELAKLATDTESDTTWQGALEEMGTAAWKTLWSAWGAESAVPRFALDVNAARKGGGASYIRDTALATGQKNEQELLSNIDNLSANSKLAQRDPQLYEEAVRSMNQDGAVKNVYMPSSGFAAAFGGIESISTPGSEQATRMNAVLDTLGVTSEIFAESLSSGADIVVPIEKYAAAVAQDQEFATLIANDRRLTEDGFTVRELDQWTRDNESALTSYIKEAQETQQATSQLDQEIEEIHWAAQQQLEAAGVPRDQAAANATQVSAFFGTMAQRADMTPLQLWRNYAPDVQMEGGRLIEAGEVLPVQGTLPVLVQTVNLAYRQEDNPSIVGHITPEIATRLPLQKQGNIILDEDGISHIEQNHGAQIRNAGFADAQTFVNFVLQNVDAVYQGNSRRTFVLMTQQETQHGQVVSRLEFREEGDEYRVVTANPVRKNYFKNKVPLWERAQSNHFQSGESGADNTSANANTQQVGNPSASTKNTSGDTDQSGAYGENISTGTGEVNVNPRGRINFSDSGAPLIQLFQSADASTFLHESGHNYLEILRALGTADNAVPEMVSLWQQARDTLNKTAGTDAVTDSVISTAAHELWASSLENYFMKGQAPSMELRSVFSKFGAWLKALYNQWRSFGVQPSEELNEIFTRMFATDEQIAEVNAWHESSGKLAKMLSDSEDGKPVRLAQKQATAKQEAESKRLATLTAAYLQALGGRKKIRETAKSTVNAIPVYAAMGEALAGTGIDIETVVDLMGEDAARSIGKKRVGLLRKEGGQDPSILAAQHGYENTYAMLTDMLKSEKKSSLVDRMAKEEEQSLRDKIAQGIAEDEAMPADAEYHSDAQLAVLLSQRQLLANRERMEGMREKQHDAQLEAKALRDAARATIATMPVRQAMQAHRHSLAERRAVRNAWEAAKVGRWEHAAEYKRQEALSHAMYMASTEARADVNKMLGKVKKAAGTKKLSAEVRDIIDNLAYRFGIFSYGAGSVQEQYDAWMQDAERDTREPKGLAKWAETVTGYGYGIDIPEWILQEGPATDYNDLSFNDFTDVAYTVLQAQKIDRQENTVAINGKRVEMAEAVLDLEAAASTNNKEKVRSQYRKQRVKETLGSLHAMHAKMEAILLNLDGWKHGIWWNTFFTPIADAENARSEMLKGVSEKIKEISAGIFPGKKAKYDFFNKRIFIESLGDSLTMNQIVSVALNMGNATNKERLLTGEGWNAAQLDAVLEHMDKPHWDFVQNVWDYLETFKSDSFALQREMTGKTPKSVEAVPVMTPYGEYSGGYYPIKYDAGRGNNAFAREQADLDKQLFGGRNYGAAMTRHGHLKERAKGGTGEPLNLDIAVISEHLFNTAQDLTHRRAVVEVAKLVRNKGIMNLIEKYAGKEVAREFKPWIQDIANEGRAQEQMIPLHRMARWARRGTTMMMMGLKVTTIVQQPLGILQTFEVLGSRATMSGLYKIYGNPAKTAESMSLVMQKSVFMRNRMQGYDREVRDAIKGLSMTDSLTHAAERFAYMGIGYMQMGVDMPTWTGAYNKALSENKGDEQAAIDYADSIVRISQGSGMTKDLARVQRGGELMRLFTMFYSYFNALYNLAWRRGALTKSFKDIPAVAASAMLLWFMPAVLSELVSGRGPDEGDDEEWAPWMAQKIAMYPMNMIVGFRDVVGAVGSGFGYQMSAAESAPKALVNWARSIYKAFDEEDPSKIVKPTIEGLGFLFILPLKQPMTTAGNIYEYTTGETPDFQLRDLFFTKQKSRR